MHMPSMPRAVVPTVKPQPIALRMHPKAGLRPPCPVSYMHALAMAIGLTQMNAKSVTDLR